MTTTCKLSPHWLAEVDAKPIEGRFAVYIKAYDWVNPKAELVATKRTIGAAHRSLASAIRRSVGRGPYHAAFILGPDGTQYNWRDSKEAAKEAARRNAFSVVPLLDPDFDRMFS